MDPLFSLEKRVAVVTGGCGLLGQQFSVALASRGAQVAVVDLAAEPRSPIVDGWGREASRGQIKVFRGSITSRADLERVLAEITNCWGTPNVLVNSAAIDSPPDAPASENGPFETYPETSFDKVVNVNLKGSFLTCQVFGGAMAKQGAGSIINVASTYGLVSPNQDIYAYKRAGGAEWYKPATYALTKSGILNFTRYLATYWAKQGVRVNTLTPGGVFNHQDEQFLREYQQRVPMGRMAQSHELNGALVFLASEASSYVTGANIVVDGGWTAW